MTNPSHQLVIGSLSVEVTVKPIKNLHLSVVPPHGSVRISAPQGMSPEHVRAYAIGKLAWIRKQQSRLEGQARERPRQIVERESHCLWGHHLLLEIREANATPRVEAHPKTLVMHVRPGSSLSKRQSVLAAWHRAELRREALPLIEKWEQLLCVKTSRLFVQLMTRQWGSCNPKTRNIRLNTQLVQKPKNCLEYVVLHELSHLLVASHGPQFTELLDTHMPDWEERRKLLNSLPLACD